MAALGKEREVAESAGKLHLRVGDVEVEMAELALHVALDANLALDASANRRRAGEILGETPEVRLPLALVGKAGGKVAQLDPVRRAFALVGVAQVLEELPFHAEIRHLEHRLAHLAPGHREDAVVMEEGAEVLRLGNLVSGERFHEVEGYLPRGGNLLRDGQHALPAQSLC